MKLRNYQTELISKTRDSFRYHKRVLSVAPCGAGKTVMFAWMAEQHLLKHSDGYVWFLVHRQELIEQTIATFTNNNINRDNILIGMVQTITRHITDYKKPTLIIFDEAHHSTSNTWTRIINAYPTTAIIGLTATPCRLDGKPLGFIYQDLIESVDTEWLINNKYLSPYKYYAPHIDLEDANWQVKGSDYDMEYVANKLNKASIYGDILKYIDINKKTIIYAPNIKYSIKLCEEINNKYGDICKHFDGNTPNNERKQIINDFRNNKIHILTNVDLIGEGFDVPDCECCFLLRPTMSVALYIQQSMRCMRYRDNKIAYIYDFVGNVYRHGLPSDKREWSLNNVVKMRNKSDDKELLVRECGNCYRVYKGNGRICPYCNYENGKTRKQVEADKKRELEEITALEKKKEHIETARARTYAALVDLGIKRGYKNPAWFAKKVMEGRAKKLNKI